MLFLCTELIRSLSIMFRSIGRNIEFIEIQLEREATTCNTREGGEVGFIVFGSEVLPFRSCCTDSTAQPPSSLGRDDMAGSPPFLKENIPFYDFPMLKTMG